jgi:hypothetical protein
MPHIFISYSQRDDHWRRKLQTHLKPWFQDSDIVAWDDRSILPGDDCEQAIATALDQAQVAVLLVSPDFLASEFIMRKEFPKILAASQAGTAKLLWIPIRASGYEANELQKFQALSPPEFPLASLGEAECDKRLAEIAIRISEAIRPRAASHQPKVAAGQGRPADDRSRTLDLDDISVSVADSRGRLWVSDGQQLKLLHFDNSTREAEFRVLPRLHWKAHLTELWQERLVVSDWSGNLFGFGSTAAPNEKIYAAQNDDLPIHRIAATSDGRLITAAWNGMIRSWRADGQPYGRHFQTARLPIHLLSLPQGQIAVADQANTLCIYDSEGVERLRWNASGPIGKLWDCSADDTTSLVVLLRKSRLVRIIEGSAGAEEIPVDPFVSAALYRGQSGSMYLAGALSDGRFEWVSINPFRLLRRGGARFDGTVVQLIDTPHLASSGSTNPSLPGLTADGRLFVVHQNHVELDNRVANVTGIVPDPDGNYLYLFTGNSVSLHRNPAVGPPSCRAELVSVEGSLEERSYRKLRVTIRNRGPISIHRVTAELQPASLLEPCRFDGLLQPTARPGDSFTLEFFALAKVPGDLPLEVTFRAEDLAGPCAEPVTVAVSVHSAAKASHGA